MTEYWQAFEAMPQDSLPAQDRIIARMPDGSGLALPLRDLGDFAVAGLISNQASFAVVDRITGWMADVVTDIRPDVIAGLPTLGHVFASGLARRLGHPNWVALGTTRKLWYDEALSVPLASITSPTAGRRLWLDPRLLPRLRNRRVLLVDDVISTGASARSGLAVLQAAGTPAVAVAVAMAQGTRWQADWPATGKLLSAFATPLFRRTPAGWVADLLDNRTAKKQTP
jgi:adenine/guanine phosphoribosyltransferase-like PRPP-binding protein